MRRLTQLIRKHPFSMFFICLYSFMWILIFRMGYINNNISNGERVAHGEGLIYAIFLALFISAISLIITILLGIFKKENRFYGYLSGYVFLPVIVVLLNIYVF